MISLNLAVRLRDAGLSWTPASGDRFFLPKRDMDADIFVLSDMTVDLLEVPGGQVIGFNGVAEWALDSVQKEEAVWLPAEHQLRELLESRFTRLDHAAGGFAITLATPDGQRRFEATVAEDAYASALLSVLESAV